MTINVNNRKNTVIKLFVEWIKSIEFDFGDLSN